MKINILNCIPKGWYVKGVGNKIKISYKINGRGNDPRPILLPKDIITDENFIAAIGMYLGDGKLGKDEYHLEFSNKDLDLILFMKNFFEGYLNQKDVSYYLKYKEGSKNPIKKLNLILKIDIRKAKESNRHKSPTITMQIGSKILRKIFENMIREVFKSNFLKDTSLRRAFLRGLFAAEGSIGIQSKENKPYINQISFNLNKDEDYLIDYISKILKLENISFRLNPRSKNNSFEIIITNWQNYWKLYKISIFDLCQRKKDIFLNIMKNLKIFMISDNKIRDKTSKLTNVYGKDISNSKIRNNIKSIRVGNLTYINDPDFIDNMLKIKFNQ